MPNSVRQRTKQHDNVRATRGDKGRRKNRYRVLNAAKGREAVALKQAALPSGNPQVSLDLDVPSPVTGTSKDHSPPQSHGYHPPYKVRRPN